MARASLVVTDGPEKGKRIDLRPGELSVGRESGNDIVLADAQVSRRHALLTVAGDSVTVRDLGSTNGTFVNNGRVSGSQVLRSGDSLRLGQTVVSVEVEDVRGPPVDEAGAAATSLLPGAAPAYPPPMPPPVGEPLAAPPPVAEERFPQPPAAPGPPPERPPMAEERFPAPPAASAGPPPQPPAGGAEAYLDSSYARRVLVAAVVLVALIAFVISGLLAST